jgi:hypothetical protein
VGPAPPSWTALATSSLSINATRWHTPKGSPTSIEIPDRRAIAARANLPVPPDHGYAR